MGENMMCPAHKTSNEKSRKGWDETFGKKKPTKKYLTTKELFKVWKEEKESPQEEVDRLAEELKDTHSDKSRIRNTEAQELLENEKLIKKFLKHSKELGW